MAKTAKKQFEGAGSVTVRKGTPTNVVINVMAALGLSDVPANDFRHMALKLVSVCDRQGLRIQHGEAETWVSTQFFEPTRA